MRGVKKIGLMLLGCCWVGLLPAQKAALQFAQQVWGFGAIKEADGVVSHAFEFTNQGSTPVVIEAVNVSCGCTTPEYSREPVRPGAKGVITIRYNPERRPGSFRKEVTVQSSGGERNVLTITGEVMPRVENMGDLYPVQAGELLLSVPSVNLGYVPRGSVKTGAIVCFNPTTRPLSVEVVRHGNGKKSSGFNVVLSANRIEPQQKGVLTVMYDLRNSDVWGMLSESFSLWVNGVKRDTQFVVSGIATDDFSEMTATQMEQAPKAVFSSQYYHFGNLKAGEEQRQNFTLTNEGKTPLVIRDMKLGSRMSTTLDPDRKIAPGEQVPFEVMLNTKDAPTGKLMDGIVLIINDPVRPMREIRLGVTIIE